MKNYPGEPVNIHIHSLGIFSGGLTSKGPHTRHALVTLYVSTLVGSSLNPVGVAGPLSSVTKLWYTHACGEYDPTPIGRQVYPSNRDADVEA